MRPLEGVIDRSRLSEPDVLKKYSLFFDKVHLLQVSGLHGFYDMLHKSGIIDERRTNAELQFLEDQGFISGIDEAAYQDLLNKLVHSGILEKDWRLNQLFHAHISYGNIISLAISEEFGPNSDRSRPEARNKKPDISENFSDSFVRITSLVLALQGGQTDLVPICFGEPEIDGFEDEQLQTVWSVGLDQFPTPGPGSAWEDILNFKAEMHDKEWHFRRFLHSMLAKKQSEAEIRDDIEWTLNEYTKAMKIHHLKAGNSFVEVYVIPVIEFAEDLAKFNWSKIAKGAVSVRKRQVELMEAEMKAPGRECAYVFEAQKRFGKSLGNSDI
jgi:hypothetical protein